jgi:MFS family permease
MAILGIGTWILILPLSLLLRHNPEQYGYLRDGETRGRLNPEQGQASAQKREVDSGVPGALRSRVFWQIALGLFGHYLVISAVLTHVMPYMATIGIARSASSLLASAIPVISICGRLSFGFLGDRFDKRWVAASGLALVSVGMFFLGFVTNLGTWILWPFLVLFGIGYGGPIPMSAALVREYFGRARLGTILGLVVGVLQIGSMVGPPLAGWAFDRFGSYEGTWLALAGVTLGGMVTLLTIPSLGNTVRAFRNPQNFVQPK